MDSPLAADWPTSGAMATTVRPARCPAMLARSATRPACGANVAAVSVVAGPWPGHHARGHRSTSWQRRVAFGQHYLSGRWATGALCNLCPVIGFQWSFSGVWRAVARRLPPGVLRWVLRRQWCLAHEPLGKQAVCARRVLDGGRTRAGLPVGDRVRWSAVCRSAV